MQGLCQETGEAGAAVIATLRELVARALCVGGEINPHECSEGDHESYCPARRLEAVLTALRAGGVAEPGEVEELKAIANSRFDELCATLAWALDLLDAYDDRLVDLGEPEDLVQSQAHTKAKLAARATLISGGKLPFRGREG